MKLLLIIGFILITSFYGMSLEETGVSFSFGKNDKIDLVLDAVQVVIDGDYYSPTDLSTNRYKIVTALNGSCTGCISEFQRVEALIGAIGLHNHYAFLVYVYGDNLALFDYYNENDIKYRYPLLFDNSSAFIKRNRRVLDNDINSFLLNTKNEIILSGNILDENFFNKVIEHSNEQPDIRDTFPIHQIESLPK